MARNSAGTVLRALSSDRRAIGRDQVIAALLLPIALVLLAFLYLVVVAVQGRPFLFRSERMKSPVQSFCLYKIRTMHPPKASDRESVLSGDQVRRVTWVGRFLRRTRLDEIPQIFNVLKGDIGFIGPRPPLRRYVEMFPELYGEVLRDTLPGITGLATVMLHRREERLLSVCEDPCEADRVYRTRCIPIKARLDMIYRDKRSLGLDLLILYRTVSRLSLRPQGRRSVQGTTATAKRPAAVNVAHLASGGRRTA